LAGYPLIDSYLEQLRQRIEARSDLPDVIDEFADHLAEETARQQAAGLRPSAAAAAAINGFGDVDLLTDHLTRGFEHRFAIPTTFTRFGGWLAGATSLAWLAMLAAWWTSLGFEAQTGWTENSEVAYVVGTTALWVAVLGHTIVVLALRHRVRAVGWAGVVGVIASALAAVTSVFGWLVILWVPLLAVSVAAVSGSCHRVGKPRGRLFFFGSSWTIGATALLIDRAVAPSISPVRDMVWLTVGGLIAIVSSGVIWRWLTKEQPAASVRASRA
jgi:hypothetical protein